METTCKICGAVVDLPKTHKDYQRLAQNPKANYICDVCQRKLKHQAQLLQKPPRPI